MRETNVRTPRFPAEWSLLDLVVRGARVEVMPVNKGFTSCESILHVAEEDGNLAMSPDTLNFIRQTGDRVIPGYLPLGRFHEPTQGSTSYSWTPVHGGTIALDDAGMALETFLSTAGRWPDVATMFRVRYGHDPLVEPPAHQPPIRWFWMTTDFTTPGAERIRQYNVEGLYVEPQRKLIHIFSNRYDSVRIALPLLKEGISLNGDDIPCVGCFLQGVASELGRERVRGALLDGQWRIQFFTCRQHGAAAPTHFVIDDGSTQYDIIGCAERGWPRLANRRWRGTDYQMACDLEPW